MGNRANYVLIEGDERRLFFSRWGALTIPSVLLSGPDATIAYVRALTPDHQLQDDVWAEGAILLDVNQRRLRFFGGVKVDGCPYLRRPLLRALRAQWVGWRVGWARYGIAELALALGIDLSLVLTTDDSPQLLAQSAPLIDAADVETAHDEQSAQSIVTIKWTESDVRDYLLVPRVMDALSLGPKLLDLLKSASQSTVPSESDAHAPGRGVYLDTTSQTLWMWGNHSVSLWQMQAVAQIWREWRVHAHAEGIAAQLELSGRNPLEKMAPEEQAIQELFADVVGTASIDPEGLFSALTKADGSPLSEQQNVTFGIGFFSADTPPLSKEQQRETLWRLLCEAPANSTSVLEPE